MILHPLHAKIQAMACPYFRPAERIDAAGWMSPPLLPLGDPYSGECIAQSGFPRNPDWPALRDWCNMGYARGRCPWIPGGGPDAVRFTICADHGDRIRLRYAVEREHEPVAHGEWEYSLGTRSLSPVAEPLLARQAEAYLASYLRRKPR